MRAFLSRHRRFAPAQEEESWLNAPTAVKCVFNLRPSHRVLLQIKLKMCSMKCSTRLVSLSLARPRCSPGRNHQLVMTRPVLSEALEVKFVSI